MQKVLVKKNTYFDSATLMALAQKVKRLPGMHEAVAVMGTDHNKELLSNVGLLSAEARESTPRDLIIAVEGDSAEAVDTAVKSIQEGLTVQDEEVIQERDQAPTSIEEALKRNTDANLVLISVPGQFAAWEARKALEAGLHVMLFSDNVPLEDEVALKQLAAQKGLLMMGPDCGTAVVNRAPLAFANVLRKGEIGIVAAAGTGLQEVSTLIHQYGFGISQALGTGGRDVKSAIGGLQMLQSIQALIADQDTKVIVVVSKPPAKDVEEKILQMVKESPKPVVVNLLGGDLEAVRMAGGIPAGNLEEAARQAVVAAGGEAPATTSDFSRDVEKVVGKMSAKQRWLRGLYTGGTLCYEAILDLQSLSAGVHTNTPLRPEMALTSSAHSYQHTVIDMGEDEFTNGRPHPMIEPSLRGDRIVQEANDPELAVLLLDFVLGYGANSEPVDAAAQEIKEAQAKVRERGGELVVVASVTGTDMDPQGYDRQVQKLKDLGVWVLPSNYQAVRFAREVIRRLEGRDSK